ncbi:MAG: cytochrome-c peroxidase [Burkholderiaceae bacterium]
MPPLLRGLVLAALACACAGAWADASADGAGAPWPAADRARVLAFGPWPPAPVRDADEPAPGRSAAAALGEQLFHSARLADAQGVRCATCHEPWRGFADGRPLALGLAAGTRRTPGLLDVATTHRRFGWDGVETALWRQSLRPLRDPREMPAADAHVAGLLRGDPALAARYAAVFGAPPGADDARVVEDVGHVLAAYVGTLASPPTPFDRWRDAWAAQPGGPPPPGLSPAALRGLRLFTGRGGCAACHRGAGFTDDARHESLVLSPGPDGIADRGADGGGFRTPGLRGAATAGPWMHDGSRARLCDALRPHALLPDGAVPARLDAAARRDVAAFLRTLAATPTSADTPCDD